MSFVMNRESAIRVEGTEIEALKSRLTAIMERAGNPMGIDIQKFGNATAFSAKNIPGPSFNTVKGLTDEDHDHVEEIVRFYNEKDIPVRLELTPAHVSSSFLTYLSELGFQQLDFHTSLYKANESKNDKIKTNVTIRELKENEFDLFAKIYTEAFNMPTFLISGVAENNRILFPNKNWTFYLASVNDTPAGIGVLFHKDHTASLAAAATLPSHRRKGIHRALIHRRFVQALQSGCDLIVGQAKFGSISQNNMEGAGMRIGYTKAIWVRS